MDTSEKLPPKATVPASYAARNRPPRGFYERLIVNAIGVALGVALAVLLSANWRLFDSIAPMAAVILSGIVGYLFDSRLLIEPYVAALVERGLPKETNPHE